MSENVKNPKQDYLRECFITKHKDKYPEEKLMCLAQTFCNMEFLGCSYIHEHANLVEKLANEVPAIVHYRNTNEVVVKTTKRKYRIVIRENEYDSDDTEEDQNEMNSIACNVSNLRVLSPKKKSRTSLEVLRRAKQQPGWRGQVILYKDKTKENSDYQICSEALAKYKHRLDISKDHETQICEVRIDSELVVSSIVTSWKKMAQHIGPILLEKLQEYCFTIEVIKEDTTGYKEIDLQNPNPELAMEPAAISSDNVGAKLMKQMGWNGKGLGRDNTGIKEPINAHSFASGQGFSVGTGSDSVFQSLLEKHMRSFIENPTLTKLIFSKDLTKMQRVIVHKIAAKYNLKSQSHGNNDDRQLTIMKKVDLWQLIEELLQSESTFYKLIQPTSL